MGHTTETGQPNHLARYKGFQEKQGNHMADLTQTWLLKRMANSIWLWPTSISHFCSFPLRMTSFFFFSPQVLLAPQIPVNNQVSRGKDCVWLGML